MATCGIISTPPSSLQNTYWAEPFMEPHFSFGYFCTTKAHQSQTPTNKDPVNREAVLHVHVHQLELTSLYFRQCEAHSPFQNNAKQNANIPT